MVLGSRKSAGDVISSASGAPLASVGEIPDQRDFTLRLKLHAVKAQPLLYLILPSLPLQPSRMARQSSGMRWGPSMEVAANV